jgi:hypothetical protein
MEYPDINLSILLQTTHEKDLFNLCHTNKQFYQICKQNKNAIFKHLCKINEYTLIPRLDYYQTYKANKILSKNLYIVQEDRPNPSYSLPILITSSKKLAIEKCKNILQEYQTHFLTEQRETFIDITTNPTMLSLQNSIFSGALFDIEMTEYIKRINVRYYKEEDDYHEHRFSEFEQFLTQHAEDDEDNLSLPSPVFSNLSLSDTDTNTTNTPSESDTSSVFDFRTEYNSDDHEIDRYI